MNPVSYSPLRPRVSYLEVTTSVLTPTMKWDRQVQPISAASPTHNRSLSTSQTDSSSSLKYLNELKQKRKIMEENTRRLTGRVIILTNEEQKVKVHVEGIKTKTRDCIVHKIDRENKKREREVMKTWYSIGKQSLEDLRQTVSHNRTKTMMNIQKMRETLHEEKKRDVDTVKGQRVKNLDTIQSFKQAKINTLQEQYAKVKVDEEKVPHKVKNAWHKRLEPVRDRKMSEVLKEEQKTKLREFEIEMLDTQEDTMLEMIKKAEKNNMMAQTQYTQVVESPVEDLMDKYKFFLKRKDLGGSKLGSQDKLLFRSF